MRNQNIIAIETKLGFLQVLLYRNVLTGKLRNRFFPLETTPDLLSLVIKELHKVKQTKVVQEVIQYYSNLEPKTFLEKLEMDKRESELKKEISLLEKEAKKEYVDLSIYFHNSFNNPYIVLNRIVVIEKERNKGLGTKYIKKAIDLSKKYNIDIVIDANSSYGNTVRFLRNYYKNLGFKNNNKIGIKHEFIYSDEENNDTF